MAKINYEISSRVSAGQSEILMRFCGGHSVHFRAKSGLFCPPERWNATKKCIIIPRIQSQESIDLTKLQRKLDELESYLILEYINIGGEVPKGWLQEQINRFHTPNKVIHTWVTEAFDEWINCKNKSISYKKNSEVIMRSWERFELYTRKRYRVTELTPNVMREFENYLRDEYKIIEKYPELYKKIKQSKTPGQRGNNSINASMRQMRTFCNTCIQNGTLIVSPFNEYKVPSEVYGTPFYITIEERNQLYAADLSAYPKLAVQRDVFVFQCCIGCRVSDLQSLKKTNVVNNVLEYVADKTRLDNPEVLRVPLNKVASEIVNRYANTDSEYLLPFGLSKKYNLDIKKVFAKAKITRLVTVLNSLTGQSEQIPINEVASSHMARRTFCGNMYKKVKDVRLVGSMSGHAPGSRAFDRYSDIDDEMKMELVNMIE